MWFPIFVLWGIWFWVLAVAAISMLLFCMDREWGSGATGTLVITALLLTFFGNVNPFLWVVHHGVLSVVGMIAYFVIGTIWSFFKWWLFVKDRHEAFEKAKTVYLKNFPAPTVTVSTINDDILNRIDYIYRSALSEDARGLRTTAGKLEAVNAIYHGYNQHFLKWLNTQDLADEGDDGKYSERPHVRNHRSTVIFWMSYWPFSMMWAVMNDFVHRVFRAIYLQISTSLQKVSDRIFRNSTAILVQSPHTHTPVDEK